MIRGKRGAVELSITTIVVVVIGVTLLALGLAWVSGIFEKLRGTTAQAFEKVDAEISEILGGGGAKEPLSINPNRITLNKGKVNTVKVTIANIEPGAPDYTNAQVSASSQPTGNVVGGSNKVFCEFADGNSDNKKSKQYTVKSGIQYSITVFVRETNAPIGTYLCNFELSGTSTPSGLPPKTLTIDVVK